MEYLSYFSSNKNNRRILYSIVHSFEETYHKITFVLYHFQHEIFLRSRPTPGIVSGECRRLSDPCAGTNQDTSGWWLFGFGTPLRCSSPLHVEGRILCGSSHGPKIVQDRHELAGHPLGPPGSSSYHDGVAHDPPWIGRCVFFRYSWTDPFVLFHSSSSSLLCVLK